MIDQHRELIARDIVPAAGQQNRVGHASLAQELLQQPREVVELSDGVGHVFDGVSLVRHGFHVEPVLVLEHRQHVVQRIVEPGIAFGDEEAGGRRHGERPQCLRRNRGCLRRKRGRRRCTHPGSGGRTARRLRRCAARCSSVRVASVRPNARALFMLIEPRTVLLAIHALT